MTDPTDITPRTVAIIDDHAMVADAMHVALSSAPDLRPVGSATTIADGIELVGRTRPDVVLTDLRLPEGDIIDHLPRLRDAHPPARILVVTGWPDDVSFRRAVEAGVHGFLDKLQGLEELIAAIRRSFDEPLVVAPRFVGRDGRARADGAGEIEPLSDRELEVLELMSLGAGTSEIAAQLYVSVNTVRNHVSRILGKLGAHSRLEAVHVAMTHGLIRPTAR